MLKTTFELMAAHKPYKDVMYSAANTSQDDLTEQGANVPSEMIPELGTYAEMACKSVGVNEVLIQGCMLYLFYFAVNRDDRRELFDSLLEQIDCSRTQAYRASAVWICFGKALLEEPDLRKLFIKESLKILSEERTPQAARNDALEMARQGQQVTIKVARQLQQQHGVAVQTSTQAEPVAPKPKPWKFSGLTTEIVLKPRECDRIELQAAIQDLELVITQLRKDLQELQAA